MTLHNEHDHVFQHPPLSKLHNTQYTNFTFFICGYVFLNLFLPSWCYSYVC